MQSEHRKLTHSIDDVTKLTGVGRSFVYEAIKAGDLKHAQGRPPHVGLRCGSHRVAGEHARKALGAEIQTQHP